MIEIEQLQAENAQLLAECQQLKAHNRQLVGAIQTHGCIPSELAGYGCHLCDLVFNPPSFAKLALAEAEVLRAAEGLVRKVEAYYVDDDTICEITSDLDYAVEAVKEAKREIVPEPASFSEDAKEKFYPHLDSYHLQKAQEENQQ